MRITLIVLSVAFLAACGRKGPPRPPEDFAPKPVLSPAISGSTAGAILSWSAPETEEDEEDPSYIPLAGFEIHRAPYKASKKLNYEEIKRISLNQNRDEKSYSFTDTAVEPGKIYLYQIKPFNEDNVAGEATVSLRITFLGENSQTELVPEKSKRIERPRLDRDEILEAQ
jgi:predicted small lipoprotein YifL